MLVVAKEKKEGRIAKNLRKQKNWWRRLTFLFTHTSSLKSPPPYEKEVEYNDVYPQLPVISQEGKRNSKGRGRTNDPEWKDIDVLKIVSDFQN